jgi:hypothetical protein
MHVYANDNSNIAKTNWKNPGTHDATEVNAPIFTAQQGYTSDNISAYLDANYVASTDAINLSLNDASIGCFPYSFAG